MPSCHVGPSPSWRAWPLAVAPIMGRFTREARSLSAYLAAATSSATPGSDRSWPVAWARSTASSKPSRGVTGMLMVQLMTCSSSQTVDGGGRAGRRRSAALRQPVELEGEEAAEQVGHAAAKEHEPARLTPAGHEVERQRSAEGRDRQEPGQPLQRV